MSPNPQRTPSGRFDSSPERDELARILAPLPDLWGRALAGWCAHLIETGRAEATAMGYARHVGWLAAEAAQVEPDPWQLTSPALSEWLAGQEWSQGTRRKVLVSLRAFYAHGISEGLCQRSPLAGLASPPPRRRGPSRLEPTPSWREPVAAFLATMQAAARRPGAIEQRRWWLLRLSETFADPWAVTTQDLAQWLARDDLAPNTKRAGLSTVRSFYAWAEASGLVTRSPAAQLASVRLPRAPPRPAPDDAVSRALATADDRARLALALAMYAGLRRAEIAGLHARDVQPDHLHVTGKGGHERRVPLHPDLASILRAEFRRRREGVNIGSGWGPTVPHPDGWLFPSAQGGHLTPAHLAKVIRQNLPPGFTTHSLRHRFATQAYQAGRDLRAVQELLGHTKPETTARYAAVPDGALLAAVHGIPDMPAAARI